MSEIPNRHAPNFNAATRDVFLAAISKGQALLFVCGGLIGIFLFRIPKEHLFDFGMAVLHGLKDLSLLGWMLFLVVSLLWFVFAKRARKKSHDENLRMIAIKKRLENESTGLELPSSNASSNPLSENGGKKDPINKKK